METDRSRAEELKKEGLTIDILEDLYTRHVIRVHKGQNRNCCLCLEYASDVTALRMDIMLREVKK